MEFTFTIHNREDAVVAEAACKAMVEALDREQFSLHEEMAHLMADRLGEIMQDGNQPTPGSEEPATEWARVERPAAVEPTAEPEADAAGEEATETSGSIIYSKEQIKEAATSNPQLAALVSKKGKKSAAEQALMQELTHQVMTAQDCGTAAKPVQPVGAALAGMTAEQLNEALRTTPNETTEAKPAVDLDFIAPKPAVETAAVATEDFSAMSTDELYKRVMDVAEERGFAWFREVIRLGGGDANKMKAAHMAEALSNPDKFQPAM